jgi:lipopolysaccharide transport system permease protein
LNRSGSGSDALPVLVLKPRRGWQAVDVGELWRFRDLLWTLALRDVKLRYRQTALGALWVVLQPLIAAGIFSFVFGTVANLPSGNAPYIVFAFAGTMGWYVFSTTLTKSSASLVAHQGMVQKVYFPRLALPLSAIPGAVLDFVVSLGVMAVLLALNHSFPGWSILALPLWLVLMLMLSLGLGLIASALMVSYRDVTQVLPVFTQMLLYISPVAYSIAAIPSQYRFVYSLNPLVGVLEGFRWSLVEGSDLRVGAAAYSAVMAVVAVAVGALVFKRMERKFADVI